MTTQTLALRIDDIGASSKEYEIYSKKWRGLGNFLFLKHLKYFRAWARYREMNKEDWEGTYNLLRRYRAKLTVGVTASWVHYDGLLEVFPKKFPEEAAILKEGLEEGLIEIANHGLTHCVLKDFLFRPHWFRSNRSYHREFWDWIDRETHFEHLQRSQDILSNYFKTDIVTLIPPGNVYCQHTLDAAKTHGIRYVNCQTDASEYGSLKIFSNEKVIAFHDKELVEEGLVWLENLLQSQKNKKYVFVKELA